MTDNALPPITEDDIAESSFDSRRAIYDLEEVPTRLYETTCSRQKLTRNDVESIV